MNKKALSSEELSGLGRIALSGALGGAGVQAILELVKRFKEKNEALHTTDESLDKDKIVVLSPEEKEKKKHPLDDVMISEASIKEAADINLGGLSGGLGVTLSVLMPLLGAKGISELFQAKHRSDMKDEITDLNEHRMELFSKRRSRGTKKVKNKLKKETEPSDNKVEGMEKENYSKEAKEVNISPITSMLAATPMLTALVAFALARNTLNKNMPKLKEPEIVSKGKPFEVVKVRSKNEEEDESKDLDVGEGRMVSASITDALTLTVLGDKKTAVESGFEDLVHAVADCRFNEIRKAANEGADYLFGITAGAKSASKLDLSGQHKYTAVKWLSEEPATRELVKLAASIELLNMSDLYSTLSAIYPLPSERDMRLVEKVAALTHELYLKDTLFNDVTLDSVLQKSASRKTRVEEIEDILINLKQK